MSNTLSENIAKVNLKLPRTLPEFNASDSSPEQLSLIPKKTCLGELDKLERPSDTALPSPPIILCCAVLSSAMRE